MDTTKITIPASWSGEAQEFVFSESDRYEGQVTVHRNNMCMGSYDEWMTQDPDVFKAITRAFEKGLCKPGASSAQWRELREESPEVFDQYAGAYVTHWEMRDVIEQLADQREGGVASLPVSLFPPVEPKKADSSANGSLGDVLTTAMEKKAETAPAAPPPARNAAPRHTWSDTFRRKQLLSLLDNAKDDDDLLAKLREISSEPEPQIDLKTCFSASQLENMMEVSRSTVCRLARDKEIPATMYQSKWYFPKKDVLEYLQKQIRGAAA